MQSIYKCKYYKKSENMNHTCSLKEQMCKIYYNETCKEYKEKEDERSNTNSTIIDNDILV